ncbi:MAG TPA: response regulator [Fibrella sp.]
MSAPQRVVYIVDDSADYRFLVGQVFKRFLTQYCVRFFESGVALFDYLNSGPGNMPFLILMDGHMPELGGAETLTLLRQRAGCEKVPVVIVSSSTSSSDQQRAYESGADSYLVKPSDMVSLKEALGILCQHWSAIECRSDAA